MKKICLLLVAMFLMIAAAGCSTDKDPNVDLEDYGFTAETIKEEYDFKSSSGNIYFRIVDELRVYEPDAEIKYLLYADETMDDKVDVEVRFSNTKFKVDEVKNHSIEGKGTAVARAGSFSASLNGVYEIKLTVKNAGSGAIIYTAKKNVGVMPKAEKVADGDFYFGVQTYYQHLLDFRSTMFDGKTVDESYDLTWDYVDYIGANLIRDGSTWASQQLTADSSVNFTNNDRIAKDAEERGVTFNWFLGGQPDWAVQDKFADAPIKWNKAPKPELWEAYIEAIAEHYKDSDNIIFEVYNECNWFDFLEAAPEEYLSMLDVVIDKVHAQNPDARITPGGMVTPNGSYTSDVESATYYKHYKELLDAGDIVMVPYHNHWGFQQFTNEVVVFRDNLLENGIDKKYAFLNECGLESAGPEQGYEVLKKALWAYGNNHSGFVMFAFRATPGAGATSLPSWGSITELNEPKELYISYGNFIRQMNGAKLVKAYANYVYNAYLFEKDGKDFLVHFKGDSAPDAAIDFGDNAYTAYDYLGNELSDKTATASATTIGKEPVYIQFDGKVDPDDITLDINFIWQDKTDFGW